MSSTIKTYDEIIAEVDGQSKCHTSSVKKTLDRILPEYSKELGMTENEVLIALEASRNVNCANWYQDYRWHSLKDKKMYIFDTLEEFGKTFRSHKSICPLCNKESTNYTKCASKDCGFSAGGLYNTMGKGILVIIKDKISEQFISEIFKPIELK